MKKIIFCCILALIIANSYGQNQVKLDSLKQELNNYKQTDSLRFNLLIETFRLEFNHNLDSALLLANEALSISQILNNKRLEAIALIHKAMYYGKNKLYDDALTLAIEAAKLSKDYSSKEEQIFIESELSSYYRTTGDPENALKINLEILELIKNDSPSPNKARYYFETGNAYGTLEDYENAEKYFSEAIQISQEIGFTPGIMAGKSTLMEVYYMNNECSKLYPLYEELFTYYSQSSDNAKLGKIKMFKGFCLAQNHDYRSALPLLKESFNIYLKVGDKQSQKRIAEKLIITHAALQNFEEADKMQTTFDKLEDDLDNEKRVNLTEELKEKYETDILRQEKEQAELNESYANQLASKNKKLFIASLVGGGALLLLAMFFIYQMQLKKRAEIAELKLFETENKLNLERQLNHAELKALKSQMNPHFLFNAFNSIQEYIILNNRELASDYLGKFADLMRIYLNHSREKLITLEDEIKASELYLSLEKIRFEDELNYAINVDKNIDETHISIPPMLIQPFIENALKHGLLHKKKNKNLQLTFELDKDKAVICTIEDNGVGRKASAMLQSNNLKKHKSFATSATQNRIELLNVGREEDITLKIIDLEDEDGNALGTKVIIRIPKN